jgi:hypothetical protein
MSPERPVVDVALRELELELTENCAAHLSDRARTLLEHVFDQTIRVLLTDRQIEWDGRAKRFCLHAAAGLGRSLEQISKGSDEAKDEHVRAAFGELVDYWEKICPLPPAGARDLRADCPARGIFGLERPPAEQPK